jgi:two-component system response regulator (stage 0 sporulation protein F)
MFSGRREIEGLQAVPESELRSSGSRRILVAEDDREMRRILTAVLRRDGYQVVEAEDGFELLDYIGSPPPVEGCPIGFDLVISDIRMPVFSGLDALAYIRDLDRDTPMILITGFGDQSSHDEARRLGATAVFDKPFDMGDLLETVTRIIPLG